MEKKNKTADYTLKAQKAYNSRIDSIKIMLPKGTKEKLKEIYPELQPGGACKKIILEHIAATEPKKQSILGNPEYVDMDIDAITEQENNDLPF